MFENKRKRFGKKMMAAIFGSGLACLGGNMASAADLGTNLVQNPGFESVDTNTGGTFGSTLITVWQGTGFAYNYAQNYDNRVGGIVPPGNNAAAADDYYFNGGHSADGGQPIFQDIDVSAGDTATAIAAGSASYNLSAYFSSYLTQGDQGTVTARFLDAGNGEIGTATIADSDLSQWVQMSASGGVPVGTMTVRIESQGIAAAGEADGYVDNVDFNIIPEPASAALLLGGLGALAMRRKRR